MKYVAIFVPEFPVASETFVVTEINALRKLGHKVCVITMLKLSGAEHFDFPVFELKRNHIGQSVKGLFAVQLDSLKNGLAIATKQRAIRNLSLLYFGIQCVHLIKSQGISHIHCHFMHSSLAYAVVAAKLANITVSSVGHGHDVYVNTADLKPKVMASNFNIAVCEDMFNVLRKIKKEGIHLLHCGVDLSRYTSSFSNVNTNTRFLFIGRLVEKKGLCYALSALSQIDKKHRPTLDIVGTGPLLEELKAQVARLELSDCVNFLGFMTPNEIADKGGDYDAFLAPFCIADNGDKDTGPVVLKEAMAMGLPAITTDIMGCKEIINTSCGYTVESRNVAALKEAMLAFSTLDISTRKTMRHNARKRVFDHFNALTQGAILSFLIEQADYENQ